MDRNLIALAIVVLAAILASIALVMEFISQKDDEAASAVRERAYLSLKYDDAKVTGPYQTIEGGCGHGSIKRVMRWYIGGELIHQRVYMVETPFKAFAVGVCRDRSRAEGYREEVGVVRF